MMSKVNAAIDTMRLLIIEGIKRSGWLDYEFWRDHSHQGNTEQEKIEAYVGWLQTLSDEDLLAAYDRVQDAESKLD